MRMIYKHPKTQMKKTSRQRELKRSQSPMPKVTQSNNDISNRRKKPSFTSGLHELQSTQNQNRTERKKSVLSKQSLHKYQNVKERVATEPVDNFERIQHLVKGSIFNNSSFTKIQLDRKKSEVAQLSSEKKVKFHIKNPQHLKTYERERSPSGECQYCSRSRELQNRMAVELEMVKMEMDRIVQWKRDWKDGKVTVQEVQREFLNRYKQAELLSVRPIIDHASLKKTIKELKNSVTDLMYDIQSLANLDFKKMLKSEIFTYDVYTPSSTDKKIAEAKQILQQLKTTCCGPASAQPHISIDLQSEHFDLMLRNLKSRLNKALRENLQLKVKRDIISRAEEIRGDQEEYIRKVIKDVIHNG